jgi:hypothetical protein
MKQVIKTRILADCWKKHPAYGTIPIEIHVMAALSASEYVLPEPRPWDPLRYEKRAASAAENPSPSGANLNGASEAHPHDSKGTSPASSRASTAESSTSGVSGNSSSTSIAHPSSSNDSLAIPDIEFLNKISVPNLSILDPSTPYFQTNSSSDSTSTEAPGGFKPSFSSVSVGTDPAQESDEGGCWRWRAGAIHRGHPSIIPLLEFFEDAHYYYLILPAAVPSFPPSPSFPLVQFESAALAERSSPMPPGSIGNGHANKFPSDMFDLVERFPYGLPPALIRGYLGQIADALAFLHSRGICHRDIKDENIVLAEDGRCWVIDFGSSGVVRKEGWDTFSGT